MPRRERCTRAAISPPQRGVDGAKCNHVVDNERYPLGLTASRRVARWRFGFAHTVDEFRNFSGGQALFAADSAFLYRDAMVRLSASPAFLALASLRYRSAIVTGRS